MQKNLIVLVTCLAGCAAPGNDDSSPPDSTAPPEMPGATGDTGTTDRPSECELEGVPFDRLRGEVCAGFVAVDFRIDDRGSQLFTEDDFLGWKGGFGYDPATRIMHQDTEWTAPFPLLADDGPWNEGGREPLGEQAGDGLWGVTVFFDLARINPQRAQDIPFGAIRDSDVSGADGQWIWSRYQAENGSLTITPDDDGQTLDAGTLVLPTTGTVDVRFTVDSSRVRTLDANDDFQPDFDSWDPFAGMRIKSPRWDWLGADMTGNFDRSTYSIQLSDVVGDPALRFGLPDSGQTLPFVIELSAGSGGGFFEYRTEGLPRREGVTVEVSPDGGATWSPAFVEVVWSGVSGVTQIRIP